MLENEFEKKVQQHLEDFRLRPSGEVWTNVEKELKEKKRRRVVFFLFMLAGLGLAGYSGYTWRSSSHTTTIAAKQNEAIPVQHSTGTNTPTVKTEASPVITAPSITEEHTTIKTAPVVSLDKNGSDLINTATPGISVSPVTNNKQPVTASGIGHNNHKPLQSVTGNEVAMTVESPSPVQQIPAIKEDHVQQPVISQEVAKNNPDKSGDIKDHATVSDPVINNKVPKDSVLTPVIAETKETPAVQTKKKKNYPKIAWGPDISTGIAFSRSTIFSLSGSTEKSLADAINSPAGVPTNRAYMLPSATKPGPAFKAGVAVEVKTSKKSSVISGLRYSLLTENIKVGSNVALMYLFGTSSSAFIAAPRTVYGGLTTQPYTNKYHFLELPLLYQLQLNKGKKLPILWNAGLSASYLLSTNALIYDSTAGGIYYKDKNAFNRFHMGVQTGLSVRLGNEKKIQWLLGPEFSFDLSKQMKQNVFEGKKYLFYGGITGRMFFDRKKK